MKLIRFGNFGKEKPGVILPSGKVIDLSGPFVDYNEAFFEGDGLVRLQSWLRHNAHTARAVSSECRLGSPFTRPSKIICVGLNYSDHARESGLKVPREPVIFFKSTTALQGPNDDVVIPPGSRKTDWEVELGVLIGKKTSRVTEEDAHKFIAGYVLHNDYSEREWQLEHEGQWVKGKSADTFAPCGPWLVTPDEIPDPGNVRLWLKVNGQIKQDGTTRNMVFKIPFLVSYISQFMTLLPGDLISTGTPAGVGLGFNPPRFLKPGDVIELGIDGLGVQRQVARAADSF